VAIVRGRSRPRRASRAARRPAAPRALCQRAEAHAQMRRW
jgi:hypothetical protein